MKSKTSFFNETIFKKNVTLYWPIWGVYTIIMLMVQPIGLWLSLYNANRYEYYSDKSERMRQMFSILFSEGHVMLIAIFAILTGMALFYYLYSNRSANMIHSLPVDRKQLYGTNVISGLAFLAVPQIISAVLLSFVAAGYHIPDTYYIWISLLLMLATDIVAFSTVTFCAMITGNILALPVYTAILNFFVFWIYGIVTVVVDTFAYGVNSLGSAIGKVLVLLSPALAFYEKVGFNHIYDRNHYFTGAEVEGVEIILPYLLVALVLYGVGYYFYKKRHMEQAGDIITVEWVKPVFRYGVGLSAAFFGTMFVKVVLESAFIPFGFVSYVICMLILGAIGYFVADMLIKKSFHVFKKKNLVKCGVFYGVMAATFLGLYGYAGIIESYVPDKKDIASATILYSYDIELTGEEVDFAIQIHEEILEQKELCEDSRFVNWIQITYRLKDGSIVKRDYALPYEYEETRRIYNKVSKLERDPEKYLQSVFCKNYEEVKDFNGGWLDINFGKEAENYTNESISLTTEQVKELYQAIVADVKAGTLLPYNYCFEYVSEEGSVTYDYKDSSGWIHLDYRNPNYVYTDMGVVYRDEDNNSYYEDRYNEYLYEDLYDRSYYIENDAVWSSADIGFGPDCENVVNKLIEFGYIQSVDDLYTQTMK